MRVPRPESRQLPRAPAAELPNVFGWQTDHPRRRRLTTPLSPPLR